MADLAYSFGALAQAEATVKSSVAKILGEVDQLTASVGNTYNTWQSQNARQAYQALQSNWNSQEDQIRAALANFGAACGQAGIHMAHTESYNTGLLS